MNDSNPPKPKRRWYQFSLRTLLIAVLVLGVFFGWLGSRLQRARKNRLAVAEVHKVEVEIAKSGGMIRVERQQSRNWLERLLGDPGEVAVVAVCGQSMETAGPIHSFGDAGLKHLKGLSQLQTLHLMGTRITNAGLEHLKGLEELQTLHLGRTAITGRGLEHVKQLTGLQSLYLYNTQITDTDLVHLEGLTHLRCLWLNNTQITDAGLGHLKGLANLEWLSLEGTQVTDDGLEHLRGLTQIECLDLSYTAVTRVAVNGLKEALPKVTITPRPTQLAARDEIEKLGGSFEWVAAQPQYVDETRERLSAHSVYLSFTKVTDARLEHLKSLPGLKRLRLSGTRVTDAGLRHIKDMTDLECLYLDDTHVTDAGLEHLKGLRNLRDLRLNGTGITDAGLLHLKGLTSLAQLHLDGTDITDAGLEHLKPLSRLHELHGLLYVRGTHVTEAGVERLNSALPRLRIKRDTPKQRAGLAEVKKLHPGQEQAIAGIRRLRGRFSHSPLLTLDLQDTANTDAALEHARGLTHLRRIYIGFRSKKFSDAGLRHLKGMNKLWELSLQRTQVADAGLEHLQGLSNMRYLRLMDTKVTAAGIEDLRKTLPKTYIQQR